MEKPLVSVIVPVYNVKDYLAKCLDSILAQDYPNTEIIIIDDGSTDESGKIAEDYAAKNPECIKVLRQENAGQGEARNKGIEISKGEYLLFVDSDDYIEHDMVSCLWTEIEKTNCDIAVCGTRLVNEQGDTVWLELDTGFPLHTPIKTELDKNVITIAPGPCNKLIKKTLFTETGIRFPSKVWYEDFRAITKLMSAAESVVFTDKCPYCYLQRQGSTMRNTNVDRNREIIGAMQDIIGYYKEKKLFDTFYSQLEEITVKHVFWEPSVRILHVTGKHKLLSELKNYTLSNFPNAFKNTRFISFVAEKGIKGKIILFCLRFKLYALLYLMFNK